MLVPEGWWEPYVDLYAPTNSIVKLFQVLDEPTGHQSIPWFDFLELTCHWADWADDATEVKHTLTTGFHNNAFLFTYNPSASYDLVDVNAL